MIGVDGKISSPLIASLSQLAKPIPPNMPDIIEQAESILELKRDVCNNGTFSIRDTAGSGLPD